TAQVKLSERPPTDTAGETVPLPGRAPAPPPPPPADPTLGLSVRDLDSLFARRMELPPSVQGVIVTSVDPAAASFVPAMRRGFVIMEINRQPIRDSAEFRRVLGAART